MQKFTNLGQNNQILCKRLQKYENISRQHLHLRIVWCKSFYRVLHVLTNILAIMFGLTFVLIGPFGEK